MRLLIKKLAVVVSVVIFGIGTVQANPFGALLDQVKTQIEQPVAQPVIKSPALVEGKRNTVTSAQDVMPQPINSSHAGLTSVAENPTKDFGFKEFKIGTSQRELIKTDNTKCVPKYLGLLSADKASTCVTDIDTTLGGVPVKIVSLSFFHSRLNEIKLKLRVNSETHELLFKTLNVKFPVCTFLEEPYYYNWRNPDTGEEHEFSRNLCLCGPAMTAYEAQAVESFTKSSKLRPRFTIRSWPINSVYTITTSEIRRDFKNSPYDVELTFTNWLGIMSLIQEKQDVILKREENIRSKSNDDAKQNASDL